MNWHNLADAVKQKIIDIIGLLETTSRFWKLHVGGNSPVNLSPKSPNLDKIATETLFVGNDSHTHPEQHIKNIDDRMQAKVA